LRPFHHFTIVVFACVGLLLAGRMLYGISWWWLLVPVLIYVPLLVAGAACIRWNFYLRAFHRGTASRQIALSFDDGPAKETEAILDILREQQVPATFFTIGSRAAEHPELVRRWHEEGHLTGNHSFYHKWNFDLQRTGQMEQELRRTNEVVAAITGRQPLYFRPPYGVTNPRLARAVKRTGMYPVGWSIRSFDTVAKDPEVLLERILSRLKGGDIILLHDSMAITREILTPLITRAREKGFTFVRVDQILELPAYA
jgi:peptidoglycan/xylan/chitin deacetylase (PgdA/CDA1 family)